MVNEMLNSAINSQPFTIDVTGIGEVEIGGGKIKVPMPFTKKVACFGSSEINELRSILTTK
jgi:hypothetical protein